MNISITLPGTTPFIYRGSLISTKTPLQEYLYRIISISESDNFYCVSALENQKIR